jgi:hypothetical protein
MIHDDDATRPVVLPPRPRCVKPVESKCQFRDELGNCGKLLTVCPYQVIPKEHGSENRRR